MENNLVSIITPCYNGEKYLPGFLESILSQTYRPIELLFIDDGSTDLTHDLVSKYKAAFDKENIQIRYFYKENGGQASAINLGLPLFKGQYLMWVDSDDILMPDNIAEKVRFLEGNKEVDFVYCYGYIVRSDDLTTPLGILKREKRKNDSHKKLFDDLINEKNVVYVPASIMCRRKAIYNSIPSLTIYEGRQGQNFQLMLPLAFCCKYGIIEKPLFKYVVHQDSHSHVRRCYEELVERNNVFCELIISTIEKIPDITQDELSHYRKLVVIKYLRKNLKLSYEFKKNEESKKYISLLKQEKSLRPFDLIKSKRLRSFGVRISNKIKRILRIE